MSIRIIAHRGLNLDKSFYVENSAEAFKNQLSRGYGIEFDIQFSKDEKMIAIHDESLNRITNGLDKRLVKDILSEELLSMDLGGNHLTTIPKLLSMIETNNSNSLSAIHLKHTHQTQVKMDLLLSELSEINTEKYIIFDLKNRSAQYIHLKNPNIQIAGSVSHPNDIIRYNHVVGETLMSKENLIDNKNIFSWAWLDEWDRTDKNGGVKSLYNKELFDELRKKDIKIAVVSPELHRSSPGLLGGNIHQDADNREHLDKRLKDIIYLEPDAICTDYPDHISKLLPN